MRKPVDKLAALAFREQCTLAYLNGGLEAFHKLVTHYEPSTPAGFGPMVYFATHHFGVKANVMGEELGFSKAALSKWGNSHATPSHFDRAAVKAYIITKLEEQISSLIKGKET